MNIGDRISTLRKKLNKTQGELASELFITDKTISSWESGRTEPSLEMLVKLSEKLECSVSYLVYGETNQSDIETEIKIKLNEKEYKDLELFMKENGKFLKETSQHDIYYQPTYRKFLKDGIINEWLRIGQRGNKVILNYKNWYDTYCDEYEVEIDNAENMNKIFNVLGLEEIGIVDKVRNSYFYLDKYEISLDYVENLGYFVEIEVKKYTDSISDEYDKLLKVAKDLNLNLDNIDRRGYPYHIIYNKLSK